MQRDLFDTDHEQYRTTVREFLARAVAPHHTEWEEAGIVDRQVYVEAARQGLLGFSVPEEYGGLGVDDFRFNVVVTEETCRINATGVAFRLQNDILAPYLLHLTTAEQRRRWLPRFARGELIAAVAMTEPDAGSDLQGIRSRAVRDGSDWVLSGSKTFISSGINADLVIVACRTDPEVPAHQGMSLLVVERDMPGFTRGRRLRKAGMHAQDTAELHFDEVRIPQENVLGEAGTGFASLMSNLPMERLSIAVGAVATSRAALEMTLTHVRDRRAFGRSIGSFQNSRFVLAELDTEVDLAQQYVDRAVHLLREGALTAVDAAKAKWWCTELQQKVARACVQLHGGYGFMREYPISQIHADATVQTIFGGSTEIMKEIIGRSLGLSDRKP
ncbi:acyl-CoA dehydrogenase family protein [Pseudonocardia xishanensis]|uniref:Acyl-[acyl-carrier-protein] dehydrogenase MbtN n=1 Tax=Pseudonocardia xishanensis TaxID=630995 RepID=A0ABP8RV92_9PSEU